jgi:uncharacterized protein YneR
MGRIIESISTINHTLRTVLSFAVVGGVTAVGYMGYTAFNNSTNEAARNAEALVAARGDLELAHQDLLQARSEINDLHGQVADQVIEIAKQALQIDKLSTSLRLIKVDHRVAKLNVLNQITDPETGVITTQIQFVEVDDDNVIIGDPQEFQLKGQIVYVDGWIVKFDDKYVEEADIERGSSLVLFRRLFGEYQQPSEGFMLDRAGETPSAYSRSGDISNVERKIWKDFWSIANDSKRARALGIRAAHGDAPSILVKKGMSYKIQLRASDGLTITPDGPIESAPTT